MILVLYTFALLDILKAGVAVLTVMIAGLYIAAAIKIIRDHSYRAFIRNTFTPALFVFILLFLACFWATKGMVAHYWDEFSHWADTVKAIYSSDMLGTKLFNHSRFMNYPPAMSLLQYFFLQFKGEYCEWLLYFVQKVFAMALLLPFLHKMKKYNFANIILVAVSFFCSLTVFVSEFYFSLYIDIILGITLGFLIGYIFLIGIENRLSFGTVCLGIMVIPLLKDAGKLFGICITISCIVILLLELLKTRPVCMCNAKRFSIRCGILMGSIIYPLLSWSIKLCIDGSVIRFDKKFDLVNFLLVLLGKDTGYRRKVMTTFLQSFFSTRFSFGLFSISNFFMLVIFLIAFILVLRCYWKNRKSTSQIVMMCTVAATFFIYTFGVLMSYMYKFTEIEALRLASFQRYMSIIWSGAFFFLFVCIIDLMMKAERRRFVFQAVLLTSVLFSSPNALGNVVSRNEVAVSLQDRSQYTELVDLVQRNQDDDKVETLFLLSQGSNGSDYWRLRYLLRPDYMSNSFEWSLGKNPYSDDDIYTRDISVEEWMDELCETYDFVVISNVDEQFISTYGDAFADPSSIANQTVYRIDKEARLLIQVH